jgi:hypothetical protein
MRSAIAVGVLVCLFAIPATSGQASPLASELPSRPVASFDVRGLNLIDALLQLGQERQVPIGIEYIDAAAFRSRITLHVRNSTLGALLDAITHGQGYRWLIHDGVVMVAHDGEPQSRRNLLNTRIPEFAIDKEVTLQDASLKLLGALYWALNPHSAGIIGDYPGEEPKISGRTAKDGERDCSADSQPYRLAAQKRRLGRAANAVEHGQRPIIRTVAGIRIRRKQWSEIQRVASGLGST